jgi:hypothetical protein
LAGWARLRGRARLLRLLLLLLILRLPRSPFTTAAAASFAAGTLIGTWLLVARCRLLGARLL